MNKPVRNPAYMIPVQSHAFGLAVAYDAYQDALKVPSTQRGFLDWNGIVVWGSALMQHQEFFGIEILPKVSVERSVIEAREVRDKLNPPVIEASF
jgi:hypothetical protein